MVAQPPTANRRQITLGCAEQQQLKKWRSGCGVHGGAAVRIAGWFSAEARFKIDDSNSCYLTDLGGRMVSARERGTEREYTCRK